MAEDRVVWIGLRRLYDAMDCSLSGREEWAKSLLLGPDLKCELYLGPKPRYGIEIVDESRDKYIGATVSPTWKVDYHSDATQSGYPRTFFTEIACLAKVAVSAELADAFYKSDAVAGNQALSMVDARAQELGTVLDLLAGSIGLRFHTQLVKKLINEHAIAPKEPSHAWRSYSSALERLLGVSMRSQQF